MPPLDGLQKNTIDVNGLATLVQQYMAIQELGEGITSNPSPAQMVLTTGSGNVSLSYTNTISLNSQGVTVYIQVLEEANNWTFQYYYIGFDTTNSSYTTSQLELYVSSVGTGTKGTFYSDLIRIAYTNASFIKDSDSYLFILWLIEFQNIPSYLVYFTPILQNNVNIQFNYTDSYYVIYFSNGNCNLACGGDCPSAGCGNSPTITNCGFIVSIQGNSVILELPNITPLGAGVSNVEVLLCATIAFQNLPIISGSVQSTLTPPVSGATFYVAIATITVTYQGS
jgi:hypothetical protein